MNSLLTSYSRVEKWKPSHKDQAQDKVIIQIVFIQYNIGSPHHSCKKERDIEINIEKSSLFLDILDIIFKYF